MYTLLLSLLLLVTPSLHENLPAQDADKALIVLVNTAEWCPVCQKNGARVEKELLSELEQDERYLVLVNDLSSEETKASSQEKLNAAGLANFGAENNGTGSIYILHPETKKVLKKISVRKSTEKIRAALAEAATMI